MRISDWSSDVCSSDLGGSVTRWQLYDTGYTERYMGNPAVDPAPYAASNAIADAGKIRTPLLLIHGMSDDNVVFDHAAQVIAELQDTDTPFEDRKSVV